LALRKENALASGNDVQEIIASLIVSWITGKFICASYFAEYVAQTNLCVMDDAQDRCMLQFDEKAAVL
jgi:hypothetical protein